MIKEYVVISIKTILNTIKLYVKKTPILLLCCWNCQNSQGQQKHKMTLFGNSYKVNLKWSKVSL